MSQLNPQFNHNLSYITPDFDPNFEFNPDFEFDPEFCPNFDQILIQFLNCPNFDPILIQY